MMFPAILHVDADAFFASIEQALNPKLKGRAVIVGGSDRGVVSAASYEARKYGVHSAMPMVQARRLCPHAVFCTPNSWAIRQFSRTMFRIMEKYSPAVERTSVDEGYVDLTGTLKLHKAPSWEVADRMLREIRSTLGINASGGVAMTRAWAKMATGLAKPNGLLYLEPSRASAIIGLLPVETIPGVGKRTEEILHHARIHTVSDLASARPESIRRMLGQWGERLIRIATGASSSHVCTQEPEAQKSYSKDRTLEADTTDYWFLKAVARELAEKLAARLRADEKGAGVITLKIRYKDFTDVSRSMSLKEPTNLNSEILDCIDRLFWVTITKRLPIRQVGVKLSGIGAPVLQTNLFDPLRPFRGERDRIVDIIRDRFGFDSVLVARGGHP
jgi:nucleotidyltransferase/DNA polymerase involved in DNA repair